MFTNRRFMSSLVCLSFDYYLVRPSSCFQRHSLAARISFANQRNEFRAKATFG